MGDQNPQLHEPQSQDEVEQVRCLELTTLFGKDFGKETVVHQAVLNATGFLQAWDRNPASEDINNLHDGLFALVDNARILEQDVLAELAEQMAVVYQTIISQKTSIHDDVMQLLIKAHDQLFVMIKSLAAEQPLTAPDELLEQLQKVLEGFEDGPTMEAIHEVTQETLEDIAALKIMVPVSSDFTCAQTPANESDHELLAIFLDEAMDNLDGATHCLYSWLESQKPELLNELQRYLHTIKGGAGIAGIEPVAELAHELEDIYAALCLDQLPVSGDLLNLLLRGHDALEEMLGVIRSHEPSVPADQLCKEIRSVMKQVDKKTTAAPKLKTEPSIPDTLAPDTLAPGTPASDTPAPDTPALDTHLGSTADEPDALDIEERNRDTVRVPIALLDELTNLAGETTILRSRIERQIGGFGHTLQEMHATINRLKEQLQRLDIETQTQIRSRHEGETVNHSKLDPSEFDPSEFDPLEMDQYSELTQLSRGLAESVTDLVDLKEALTKKSRSSENLLLQQARINSELRDGLMRTRMLPFNRLLPRLRKTVRQVSTELGKPVELKVVNAEGEMERSVMERIIPPLEHMLRNAIDHGIEDSAAERIAKGKNEMGEIRLNLTREGSEIILSVADDGRGLDLGAIRRRAVEQGLLSEGAEISDREISRFILQPGFTTAASVTRISGRGVGMDVVNSELKQLGGQIDMHLQEDLQEGYGIEFEIRLPMTLSVQRALMVNVGEEQYAVPLNTLDAVVQLSAQDLQRHYQNKDQKLKHGGRYYQLCYLGALLHGHQPDLENVSGQQPVLLIRFGEKDFAIHADCLVVSREIVVKSLGTQFSGLPGVHGATIFEDGQVIIILDPVGLLKSYNHQQLPENTNTHQSQNPPHLIPKIEQENNLVMIVDDSVTVRKITGRLLKRNGYRTLTARDGVEAMAFLKEHRPAVILLDIEMPRMDGFEVASAVRNHPELKAIPIIMITSRYGEKHRQKAKEIGVHEYMAKPFQEAMLLETIGRFTRRRD